MARVCEDFGQRVQFSVFECAVGEKERVILRDRLLKAFDPKEDSLRFYDLGEASETRVEHYGAKPAVDFEGTLIT